MQVGLLGNLLLIKVPFVVGAKFLEIRLPRGAYLDASNFAHHFEYI
jgi:hypothetical protein